MYWGRNNSPYMTCLPQMDTRKFQVRHAWGIYYMQSIGHPMYVKYSTYG